MLGKTRSFPFSTKIVCRVAKSTLELHALRSITDTTAQHLVYVL